MNILIVDDHEVVREGVRRVLEESGRFSRIDEAGCVQEAVKLVGKTNYDAVLLDMSLPDGTGVDALREIKSVKPALPVLILSMHPEETWALRMIRLGAGGYMSKSTPSREIVAALLQVACGKRYLSGELAERLADPDRRPSSGPARAHETLSNREFEVMKLMASGKPVGDVARILGLSTKTVSTHREHILEKMGFSNNMEIIRYCLREGLMD